MRRRTLQDNKSIEYEFVDMGLSVKWATCNIGATKPEQYGWYFQWGGTIPYNFNRTPVTGGDVFGFDWLTYPLCNNSGSAITKYCTQSSYGVVDNKTTLEPEDDAAHIYVGGESRMPADAEYRELINACDITWETDYNGSGVRGCLFVLKSDSSKTLFFPAAGGMFGSSWSDAGSYGYYWSSSLNEDYSQQGRCLEFGDGYCTVPQINRCYGLPVRAVLPPTKDGTNDLSNIVFCEKSTGKLFQTPNPTTFDKNKYEPIGIVVIPSSHDVYGTGECGVMALHDASTDSPDSGSTSNPVIKWGQQGVDIPELYNYDGCPSYGDYDNWNDVSFETKTTYLPSDRPGWGEMLTNKLPGSDQESWYYNDISNHIPSPYLADGSRNPDYYNTVIGAGNVLSDFSGKSNTEALISKHTEQPNWKTDASITDNSEGGYSPAACACWRYTTPGTKQGDWYFPAMGELGYACARFQKINDTISSLQSYFGKTYSLLSTGPNYWSSSENSDIYSWYLSFYYGDVSYGNYKYKTGIVRPFMRGNLEIIETPQPDNGNVTINGYEFVDMGLSVKWATCNIGATKPEERGHFFQWGGTIPYNSNRVPVGGGTAIEFDYNSNCPHWFSGTTQNTTKWSKYTATNSYSSTGVADNKLILEPTDDAAHIHIGGGSRMPTTAEYEELLSACNTSWVTNYNGSGINGRLFTLKDDPSKTLFFPTSGYLTGTSWYSTDSYGYCWSSSLPSSDSYLGGYLYFNSSVCYTHHSNRCSGRPIRAVLPSNN